MYKWKDGDLIHEDSPTGSTDAYIKEKLWAETKIKKLSIPYVILRISAPYGPRQRSQTVLKTFIERALRNEDLYYYGTGSRTQDFTHIKDVANAVSEIVDRQNLKGVFNIASGNSISMKNLATLVLNTIPTASNVKVLASGLKDNQEYFRPMFDITKARELLGWTPKTQINQGIYEWYCYIKKFMR